MQQEMSLGVPGRNFFEINRLAREGKMNKVKKFKVSEWVMMYNLNEHIFAYYKDQMVTEEEFIKIKTEVL